MSRTHALTFLSLIFSSIFVVPINARPQFTVQSVAWIDGNCDGLRADTEGPMVGQSLWLLAPGADGLANTDDDQVIEYAISGPTGQYFFTLGATELDYSIRILARSRPILFMPAPLNAGSDRTRDNDLRADIWGANAFRMHPTDTVTGIDIGFCRNPNVVLLPLITN